MRLILLFDVWLVTNAFEPLAWRFEHYCEKNCFWLARVSMSLSILIVVGGLVIQGWAMVILFGLPNLAAWFGLMFMFFELEKSVVRRPEHLNPYKSRWYLRLSIVGVQVLVWLGTSWTPKKAAWDLLNGLLFVAAFYFVSCNPKPPKWEPRKKEQVGAYALKGT